MTRTLQRLQVTETTRKAAAELIGSALLAATVVGSGIAAQTLSPDDTGLQLLENALITGAVLVALILALGPVSAAFNPVGGLWLGEVVATFGLLVVIFGVVRSGRAGHVAYAVGGYITAAYWFTSSTSFANPAITVGRTLSDTFAGIAPGSAPMFVLMQLVGGALGLAAVLVLYPQAARLADDLTRLDTPDPERLP